jgi:hypothetical protein
MRTTALLVLCSCASVGGVTERSYVRGELDDLELKSLDVVIVAKGPPLAAPEFLEIVPFEAPDRTTALGAEADDPTMREALAVALAKDLTARGFAVHFAGAAEAPPVASSTVASSTVGAAFALPGEAHLASHLAPGSTLEDLRLSSTADGILVVRAVMVDFFHLHEPAKTLPRLPGDTGVPRQQPGRVYRVSGRLLIGQAFLFDRKTGVRLWSRQLPDFPEGGKILEKHPILGYGFVQQDRAAISDEQKAELAAPPFVASMLGEFPRAHDGKAEARAALDAVDVEAELREEQFFDDSKFMLELEASYAGERSGSDLVLDGEALPSVGTGAVSPNGIARGGFRVGYLAPSALVFSVAGQFGFASSSFARSYHRDSEVGTLDRNASVTIDGTKTFGAELGVGYLILLSESLMLLPGGDVFLDAWAVDAAPSNVVEKRTHLRIGIGLDLDLLWSLTPWFFARLGVGGRGGFDTGGPGLVGGSLSLGAGVFL